jgi:hypothetical protein
VGRGIPEIGESEIAGVGHIDSIEVVGSRPWEMLGLGAWLCLGADGDGASNSCFNQFYVIFVGARDL